MESFIQDLFPKDFKVGDAMFFVHNADYDRIFLNMAVVDMYKAKSF